MARTAQAHLDADGKLVERPGPRPGSEQRLRVGAHADVNGRPLLKVEVRPCQVDVGGEDEPGTRKS